MSRTIWIGDVHGCAAELAELFDQLAPTRDDRVVFVGDLVARGPDTRGVLRLAREVSAVSVLGNHEHRLLLAHEARRTGVRGPRLGSSHQSLLHTLTEEDWDQLAGFPLSLEFPDHGVRVVHAGVAPGVPFEEQQAWTLLHVRSLTSLGAPSDRYSPVSWAASYEAEPHLVFGHNAQAGLQLAPRATGLDTACVYGGRLTALVLAAGERPPAPEERRARLVSVPAKARYVDYGPKPVEAARAAPSAS